MPPDKNLNNCSEFKHLISKSLIHLFANSFSLFTEIIPLLIKLFKNGIVKFDLKGNSDKIHYVFLSAGIKPIPLSFAYCVFLGLYALPNKDIFPWLFLPKKP